MACQNECSPCSSNVCDCTPCEPVYTDNLCLDTVKLKCTSIGVDIECLDVHVGDTGEEIIIKIIDAICNSTNLDCPFKLNTWLYIGSKIFVATWLPITDATKYKIQVFTDVEMSDLVIEEETTDPFISLNTSGDCDWDTPYYLKILAYVDDEYVQNSCEAYPIVFING